jgi:hypothetical protein
MFPRVQLYLVGTAVSRSAAVPCGCSYTSKVQLYLVGAAVPRGCSCSSWVQLFLVGAAVPLGAAAPRGCNCTLWVQLFPRTCTAYRVAVACMLAYLVCAGVQYLAGVSVPNVPNN